MRKIVFLSSCSDLVWQINFVRISTFVCRNLEKLSLLFSFCKISLIHCVPKKVTPKFESL